MTGTAARTWLSGSILILMVATSFVGHRVQPSAQQAPERAAPGLVLAEHVPGRFGDWRLVSSGSAIIANPEVQASLGNIYSDVLTRTYEDAQGYRVMVSVAYGDNQRGGLQAHFPEFCYRASGFDLLASEAATIATPVGTIQGKRLVTRRDTRHEPVTYWFSLGGRQVSGRFESRFEELRFVLSGQAPEGVLFRLSSIDADAARAHREHERFAAQLMAALPADQRRRIGGL